MQMETYSEKIAMSKKGWYIKQNNNTKRKIETKPNKKRWKQMLCASGRNL